MRISFYWKSLGPEIVQQYENRNENVSICLLATIEIHSDVTPSYALMWSDRRGL
jgi:hypothetical protein